MESVQVTSKYQQQRQDQTITRTPGSPEFKALYFHSWKQIARDLNITDFKSEVILTDLSQGAWKGHWVAREFQQQLSLRECGYIQPLLHEENYADIVGRLIDNESEGDKNFNLSLENCIAIRSSLIQQQVSCVMVIPPKGDSVWEEENLQFIRLLYHALQNRPVNIVLLLITDSVIPDGWRLDFLNSSTSMSEPGHGKLPFYPGIWKEGKVPGIKVGEDQFVQLKNSFVVPNPGLRSYSRSGEGIKNEWEKESHLHAAFQVLFASEPNFNLVHTEAARRFAEGGYGIALRLLTLLLEKLKNPYEREATRSKIQNIRIALMQFEDAAKEYFITDDLPEIFKASLNQSKAWGLVMCNKPHEAEPYFEVAQKFLDEKEYPRLYLYLLNISALNKLRIGNLEEAFALEKRIENSLDKQDKRDWHITYINNINQARLYKKAGQLEMSETYYLRAFEVNAYVKNESDLLYSNFCLAQLEELKQNSRRAFIYWLRSCIHWLSNQTPESLAPRVAQAILKKNLSGKKAEVEEISLELLNLLQQSVNNLGLMLKSSEQRFNFIRPGISACKPIYTAGTHGWGFCISEKSTARCYSGTNYNQLANLVSDTIRSFLPAIKWNSIHTILSDTQYGEEMPATPEELLLLALRAETPLIFGRKQYVVTKKDREEARLKMKAGINPAIDFVAKKENSYIVFFKRYLPPLQLNIQETEVLERVQSKNSEYSVDGDIWMNLAKKRVVQLYMDE
ncbi:MAG: hypothetical protein JJU13_05825 [Balneolaceae bacterium]|nr:hypothetical protein [Balneolaceae bacterium]